MTITECSEPIEIKSIEKIRQFTTILSDKNLAEFRNKITSTNANSKINSTILERINWNTVYKVFNNETQLTTYTIPLTRNVPYEFDNLIVVDNALEQYAYIIRYKPDLEWMKDKRERGGFNTFTGTLEIINLNGEVEATTDYQNGIAISKNTSADGRTATCETWIDVVWTEVCVEGYGCSISEITWTEYEVCDNSSGGGSSTGGTGSEGPSGGGGSPTPIGGGDPGTIEPCANGELLSENGECPEGSEFSNPGFKICNRYIPFDAIPSDDGETSFTGQVNRVHAPAVNNTTGESVEAFWGSWCVTFGTSAINVNSSIEASTIFKEAWAMTTAEAEAWLNLQSQNPGNIVFSNQFLLLFEGNISLLAGGYVRITTGGCIGNVSTTWLTYCR